MCSAVHVFQQDSDSDSDRYSGPIIFRFTRGASLEDSSACGCRYCSAVCEVRPELANRDDLEVELLRNSLFVTYRGVDSNHSHWYTREFFTLNGKPASIAVDELL